eukprot:2569041-Rhodomonas_salina.2
MPAVAGGQEAWARLGGRERGRERLWLGGGGYELKGGRLGWRRGREEAREGGSGGPAWARRCSRRRRP